MTDTTKLSITKREKYNQISTQAYALLKNLSDFYGEETEKLVYHLYKQDYSVQKVADILGVTKQAISLRYPKGDRV